MSVFKVVYLVLIWTAFSLIGFQKAQANLGSCEKELSKTGLLDFIDLTDLNSLPTASLYEPEEFIQAALTLTENVKILIEDIATDPAEASYKNTILPVLVLLDKYKKLAQLGQNISSSLIELESYSTKESLRERQTKIQKIEKFQLAQVTAERELAKTLFDLSESDEFRTRLSAIEFSKTVELNAAETFYINQLIQGFNQVSSDWDQNPLLKASKLDYGAIPFDKIKIEHFYPAIHLTYRRAKRAFEELLTTNESPNFQNTIEALIHFDRNFERVQTALYIYEGSYALPEYRDELSRLVMISEVLNIELQTQIFTNEKFFKKVQIVSQSNGLTDSQTRYVKDILKSFDESGFKLASSESGIFQDS